MFGEEKARPFKVGRQAENVLAVYRPTDRLEGGDVLAQVWRDDFATDGEWKAAAQAIAKAMNDAEADRAARLRYSKVGRIMGTETVMQGPNQLKVQLDEVLALPVTKLAEGMDVYVQTGHR